MESDKFKVLVVCDIDFEKAEEVGKEYQLQIFDDIDDLLNVVELDVAIVTLLLASNGPFSIRAQFTWHVFKNCCI